jgi:pSer/pThr/pTyr-binding forkhead associated (FHA) protein
MTGSVLLVLRLLVAVSLYAFLGLALSILWRDLKRQSGESTRKAPPRMSLAYQGEDSSQDYHYSVQEITIGRDISCECAINDTTVSAQHARLSYRQGQWWVEDLNSTNGTYLNHELVLSPLVITSGDLLRLGQALFTIKIDNEQ